MMATVLGIDAGLSAVKVGAFAPDGKHMVISSDEGVFFLNAKGKVLKHWKHEKDLMVQPTFTPDSRHVAMKYMCKEEDRAAAIVLLTADGKEVSRVAVPKIKPSATRPATRPATLHRLQKMSTTRPATQPTR